MAAIGLRAWSLDARDYTDEQGRYSEAAFHQAVVNELAQTQYLSHRLGVAVVSAPIRVEVQPGEYRTTGWQFRTATVPAVRFAETFDDAAAEVADAADAALDEEPDADTAPEPADVAF